MIQLYINRQANTGGVSQYLCENLLFQSFYLGRRRDELNLKIVRKFTEGSILIKNPDFDELSDYFGQPQSGNFYIGTTSYDCVVSFSQINYLTKKVVLSINITDQYSGMFGESPIFGASNVPLIETDFKISDLYNSIDSHYIDGSSYMYDGIDGTFWGVESVTVSGDKDVLITDIEQINSSGADVSIGDLIIEKHYLDLYYKPTSIYYTNRSVTLYQEQTITFSREFRYFEETQDTSGWNWIGTEKIHNGKTYIKYVRELYEDTYFSGKDVYFVYVVGSTHYVLYDGQSNQIKNTSNLYSLYDLTRELTIRCLGSIGTFLMYESNYLYVSTLNNFNTDENKTPEFNLLSFFEFLRNKLNIFFELEDNNVEYSNLDFNTKLLDIDSYKGRNWHENNIVQTNPVAQIYKIESGSDRLDFKEQIVSFFGHDRTEESISSGIITDIENEDKEGLILLHTTTDNIKQNNKRFNLGASPIGEEAIFYSRNGESISWDSDNINAGTPYLDIRLQSQTIDFHLLNIAEVSYSVIVDDGSVTVSLGSYSKTHTSTEAWSFSTAATDEDFLTIEFDNISGGDVKGKINSIVIKSTVLVPKETVGAISGANIKNGKLSNANSIIEYKPQMSYLSGYMEDYGGITTNVKYFKEINFKIPLTDAIFELDFKKYMSLDSEKYVIFERKRQVLTETEMSQYDLIKCKSNEVS